MNKFISFGIPGDIKPKIWPILIDNKLEINKVFYEILSNQTKLIRRGKDGNLEGPMRLIQDDVESIVEEHKDMLE